MTTRRWTTAAPLTLVLAATAAVAADKIKVKKLDDLPRHAYKVSGKVGELMKSDKAFAAFAAAVRADLEADLAKYDIEDKATLARLYGTLAQLDVGAGRYDDALKHIRKVRQLLDKPANRLTAGLVAESIIAARRAVGRDADQAAYRKAFKRHFADKVTALPWDVVQDTIKQARGMRELMTENMAMGFIAGRVEPAVRRTGQISGDLAPMLISMHTNIKCEMPLRAEIIAVYQDYINQHKTAKPDIWAARSVTLTADQKGTPVVVAVWDSGVDEAVFTGRLWTNPDRVQDGGEAHGIAYDLECERAPELLQPLGAAAGRVPELLGYMKGFMDVRAAVASPEATALRKKLSGLKPDQVKAFMEDLNLCANYSHGTHVAGIALDGNPFARLLIARLTFDHRSVPKPWDEPYVRKVAAMYADTVRFFERNHVRVVNMSWGDSLKEIERALELNGVGKDGAERAARARRLFDIEKKAMYDALKRAPDILFVVAAGNLDNDVAFDEMIPPMFDLPNVLVVGAVDQAGEPTGFTSFGPTVRVYANGFEVDSYVPGGKRLKLSGTSMASPNVANLAAKLLAVKPGLKPVDLIDLIKQGGDRVKGPNQVLLLINPRKTVALVRGEAAGK
jgi:subtilisin family serine protease